MKFYRNLPICVLLLASACSGGGASKNYGKYSDAAGSHEIAAEDAGAFKVGKPYEVSGKWYYPEHDEAYEETGRASWYGPGFHGKKTANGAVFDKNAMTAAHRTLPLPSVIEVTNLSNDKTVKVVVNDRGPFSNNRILDLSEAAAKQLDMVREGVAGVRVKFMKDESEQLWSSLGMGDMANKYAYLSTKKRGEPVQIAQSDDMDDRVTVSSAGAATYASDRIVSRDIEELGRLPSIKPDNNKSVAASEVIASNAEFIDIPGRATEYRKAADAAAKADVISESPRRTASFVQAGAFANAGNAARVAKSLSAIGPTNIETINIGQGKLYRLKMGPFESKEAASRILGRVKTQGFEDARILD